MTRWSKRTAIIGAVLLAMLGTVTGCSSEKNNEGNTSQSQAQAEGKAFKVYATTGYLADAVVNIAPNSQVTTMVGPGGDPHTFEPSTKDIETIQNSDIVFWTGLHLEAMMVHQLESLGDKQLCVGDQIPEDMLLPWPETFDGKPLHDPHIWNSPEIWTLVVKNMAEKFAEEDPDAADFYRANAETYANSINEAVAKHKETLSAIPEDKRYLITGHDAFNYFGRTYGLEIRATDFVSSTAKLSPEELSELADMIANHKIPVIFQDNLANPQAITSLKEAVHSRGWDVTVSNKELFADSLGAEAPMNTYLGAMEHNVTAVAEALGEK